jgi:hypothetical protein
LITTARILTLVSLLPLGGHAQVPLPADVHPDSRNRLPSLGPGALGGVDGIVAHGSGVIVRWEFALGRPLSELAILTVARELDQPYEWSLHEVEALAVGLESEVIEVVKHRRPLTGLGDREAAIVQMGRELIGGHALSAETHARAEALLGRTNLVDIAMLMGEYAEDAVRLTAFNQHMPPGWRQFLPLPFEMPDDIHSDSRSRLPYLRNETRRESATPPLYGRGLAPEGTGPGQITRRSRGVEALRASVGPRLVRLARLIAARELDDVYTWTINEIAAGEEGLEPGVIDVVRRQGPLERLAVIDAVLVAFGRELLADHLVDPSTYARALEQFGEADLVGFVNLFARHASDAALLIAFDQHLPSGQAPLLQVR